MKVERLFYYINEGDQMLKYILRDSIIVFDMFTIILFLLYYP